MGLRYRKSAKIAPGIKMNISKTGIGFSAGARGAHVSAHSSGRVSASAGVPGSGLSYTTSSGGTKRRSGCLIPTIIFMALVGFIFYGFSSCISSGSKSSVPAEISAVSSSSGVTTTISPVDPDAAALRTQAMEGIKDFLITQGYEVTEAKKTSTGILEFAVISSEIADATDLSVAPENWEEAKQSLVAAFDGAAQEVSHIPQSGFVIYLQDSEKNNLATCLNGDITYDKFKIEAEKQESNEKEDERRVWVTNSGDKYHNRSTCSNMKNPYTLPVSEAILHGYTMCSKCW